MRRILALTLALILAQPILAQPTPIQPPVVKTPAAPIKAKVTPTAPKGSEQLVIDASAAKGKVTFKHDFPAGTFAVEGKKLFAALPAKTDQAKKFTVWLTYWTEEAQEELTVTVPPFVKPVPPPDPEERDTLKQLRADMMAGFSTINNRLTVLEKQPFTPPVTPPVVDPFVAKLQAAYEADGKPAPALADLASIYRQSSATVNKATFTKESEIRSAMHDAAENMVDSAGAFSIRGKLLTVRRVLADELNAQLGKTDKALDVTTRAAISAQFLRAQRALEGVH